jgi:hypothetical protein
MLFCRQVARALAENRHWELPWYRRWAMEVHISLCRVCGNYHRQVIFLQDAARSYVKHETHDEPEKQFRLSPDARNRMQDALLRARNTGGL